MTDGERIIYYMDVAGMKQRRIEELEIQVKRLEAALKVLSVEEYYHWNTDDGYRLAVPGTTKIIPPWKFAQEALENNGRRF
jgi:hypothetical protein